MNVPAALILLNGEIPDPRPVKRACLLCRGVICADGALKSALKIGIEPDFVVGDMDSLPHPLPRLKKTVFRCDFSQGSSDFEKCLTLARRLGIRRLYIAGALGKRLDHSLINWALIEKYSDKFEMTLLHEGSAQSLGHGHYRLPLKKGSIFSLLAQPKAKLSLKGARYPLKNEILERGSRGLENEVLSAAVLDVHEGRVWLCHSNV